MTRISRNGATAYREGAVLADNPFDKKTNIGAWESWNRMWRQAQEHFVGKAKS